MTLSRTSRHQALGRRQPWRGRCPAVRATWYTHMYDRTGRKRDTIRTMQVRSEPLIYVPFCWLASVWESILSDSKDPSVKPLAVRVFFLSGNCLCWWAQYWCSPSSPTSEVRIWPVKDFKRDQPGLPQAFEEWPPQDGIDML